MLETVASFRRHRRRQVRMNAANATIAGHEAAAAGRRGFGPMWK
jgi:hypothetical protein